MMVRQGLESKQVAKVEEEANKTESEVVANCTGERVSPLAS